MMSGMLGGPLHLEFLRWKAFVQPSTRHLRSFCALGLEAAVARHVPLVAFFDMLMITRVSLAFSVGRTIPACPLLPLDHENALYPSLPFLEGGHGKQCEFWQGPGLLLALLSICCIKKILITHICTVH